MASLPHRVRVTRAWVDGKRSFIYAGDKFRVSGSPYFLGSDDEGKRMRVPMGERGVFVFRRYCELGASKWIEVNDESGMVIIYVGRPLPSKQVEGLRLQPHTIRPEYERKRRKKKSSPLVQPTLFD